MKICSVCGVRFLGSSWACPSCHHTPAVIDGYLTFSPLLAKENDGFEKTFFAQLIPLEARNFWFRSRNRLIIWALRHYFPNANNFLEIGCGTGFVLGAIEQADLGLTLSGSEIFTKGLDFAASRLSDKVGLFQMDARSIPFEKEFDVIGAFDVLEHIQEDQTVLTEMYRATTSTGGIMLTVPQHPWLWSQADSVAHHVRRYRAQEFKVKVEQAGFKVVRMTSFVSLLLPLMVLSRLQQRNKNSQYDANSELKIEGWLNQILEQLMTCERQLIQAGFSFYFGGSLLVIAKK